MTLEALVKNNLSLSEIEVAKDLVLVKEIQQSLQMAGLVVGQIDGVWGQQTEACVNAFCKAHYLDNPLTNTYGASFAKVLLRAKGKFKKLSDFKGGGKWETVEAICKECDRFELKLSSQKAYVLATVEHECDNSWQPIREYGGDSAWYAPWYGRGFSQLTHESNYRKYEQIIGVPLTQNADLALRPDVALFVLVHGFKFGTFTGYAMSDFIDLGRENFYQARKIINGLDRADHIAAIAQDWKNWIQSKGKA
jgi:predicted chitinase